MLRKTQLPYQKVQVLERVGGQRRRTFYQALHLSHQPVQVGECCFPIPHAFVPWAGNRTHDSAITKRHSPFRVYPVWVPILSSRDLKLLSQTFDAVLRTAFISAFHSITLSTTIMGRCSEPNQEKGEDLRTRSRMITNDGSTIDQDRASARLWFSLWCCQVMQWIAWLWSSWPWMQTSLSMIISRRRSWVGWELTPPWYNSQRVWT